jgi:hypothetical protein
MEMKQKKKKKIVKKEVKMADSKKRSFSKLAILDFNWSKNAFLVF